MTAPGQLPSLVMALASAVVVLVSVFWPGGLSDVQKAALTLVFGAALAVGIYLYAIFGHRTAIQQMKMGMRPLDEPPKK